MYIENPKDSIRKLLELLSEFSKVAEYKSNTHKSLAFLYTNNEKSEREMKESIAFISHTSKVMLKILQARLQQYMNRELPDVQAGFRRGRGTKSNCQHLLDHRKSRRVPEKHLFLLY